MEAAIISGAVAILVAVVTAFFTFRGKQDENNIAEIRTVLDSYREIVSALNREIERLKNEIEAMRKEMQDCDTRNSEMEIEISRLRGCVTRLEEELEYGR